MSSLTSPPARVAQALAQLKAGLVGRFGDSLSELRLFGSCARGVTDAESDVDILVVLETAGWKERREVIDLAADVGLEHTLLMSPTVFDRATWSLWCRQERPLAQEIARDGIPL